MQLPKRNGDFITVRMERGAAVAGQRVEANGRQARAGVELKIAFRSKDDSDWHLYSLEPIKTDQEGRFRVGSLLPDYEFRLSDDQGRMYSGRAPASAQTMDAGKVHLKRSNE
jgi:hypothetical protein